MGRITVILNGEQVRASSTETVLDVTRREGIYVPTLCHVDALKPLGACRMCLVQIAGPTMAPRIVTACTRPVFDKMEITTDTDTVQKTRRQTLALLLGRAPRAKRLLAMAERLGVNPDEAYLDPEAHDCVLCGICVRVCAERIGREAIAFSGRSSTRVVTAAFQALSESCIGCGTCANLCPTGCMHVIDDEQGVRRLFNDRLQINEFELVRCSACGKPFATDAYIDWLREKAAPPVWLNEDELLCPECARIAGARRGDTPMRV